jgi:hypothetical protein
VLDGAQILGVEDVGAVLVFFDGHVFAGALVGLFEEMHVAAAAGLASWVLKSQRQELVQLPWLGSRWLK